MSVCVCVQQVIMNCTILKSYCSRKSSARRPRVKVSSEGLSTEIDILIRSTIHVLTKADVATLYYAVVCSSMPITTDIQGMSVFVYVYACACHFI